MNTILASSCRVQTLETTRKMSDEQKKREEHEQFMKDWGKTKTKKNVMKDFP
jgi:hypothetical protein